MTLTELFARYPTDKDTDHSYGEVYDELFAPLRLDATWVMELGIDKGGSLMAWRDYFENAEIVGIDADDDRHLDGPRLKTIRSDLRVHHTLVNAVGESGLEVGTFDLIIDDGPHNLIQQVGCLYVLWEYLKPCGLYIIEDAIQMHEYVAAPRSVPFQLDAEVIDRRHLKGRSDDILIIFRKGK